jgi:hypothetical protein
LSASHGFASRRDISTPDVDGTDSWQDSQDKALGLLLDIAVPVDNTPEDARPEQRHRRVLPALALIGILTAQACLSVRLLHLDTAFADEALYLWVGHMDWAHLFHGTPMPPFATYLSGSPVFYPPVGAIADSIAGLTGARVLSLLFMLVATWMLWLTATRLYGYQAALFATALWALLGETLRLGAFATYDAMACALLTVSAYAAVRAAQSDSKGPQWAIASAVALTVANCTKYATGLFDPVVVCLVITTSLTVQRDRKRAIRLGGIAGGYLAIFLSTLIVIATTGNGYYAAGIAATTTSRASSGQTALQVLESAKPIVEVVGPIALLGIALCLWLEHDWSRRLVTLLLVVAGTLAPLNQARIHTSTSLDKHADFGAWFMAMAAGYAIAALRRGHFLQRAGVTLAAAGALAATLVIGIPFAKLGDSSWPDTAQLAADTVPLLARSRGEILFQNSTVIDYDVGHQIGWTAIWKRISGQGNLRLPNGKTTADAPVGSNGIPGPFIAAVHRGYFQYVILNNDPGDSFDAKLIPVLFADPHYVLRASPPGFFIWAYVREVNQ